MAAASKARLTATVVRPGPPFGPHTAARIRRVAAAGPGPPRPAGGRRRGPVRGRGRWPGRRGPAPPAPPASRRPEATCSSPSWRSRRSLSSSPAEATPTTASPAPASRARASRSSQRVPAATRATSAWPAAATGQQVAQVVAAVQHLRGDLPGLAGLHQGRLPRRPHPPRSPSAASRRHPRSTGPAGPGAFLPRGPGSGGRGVAPASASPSNRVLAGAGGSSAGPVPGGGTAGSSGGLGLAGKATRRRSGRWPHPGP